MAMVRAASMSGRADERIGDRHQVPVALVSPHVAPDALDELLPEAGGAARIGQRHGIALRHHQQRVPAPVPAVLVHADRPAMDPEQRAAGALPPRAPFGLIRKLWIGVPSVERHAEALHLGPVMCPSKTGQARERLRRRFRSRFDDETFRRVEQGRAQAGDAAIGQHHQIGVRAAAGQGSDALDVSAGGIDSEHRCVAGVVGGHKQPLSVRTPAAPDPASGPIVRRSAACRRWRHRKSSSAAAPPFSALRVVCTAAMARPSGENTGASTMTLSAAPRTRLAFDSMSISSSVASSSRSLPAVWRVVTTHFPSAETSSAGSMANSRRASGVRSARFAPAASQAMRCGVRHVGVVVQPVIPVTHRLRLEAARAGAVLVALRRAFALLLRLDAGEHRREQNQPGRAFREAESFPPPEARR